MAYGFIIRKRFRGPPEQVWELLVEPARAGHGQEGRDPAAGLRATGQLGVGTRYHAEHPPAGAPPGERVVTQWQPKRRFGESCRTGRLNATFLYTLRGHHRGTDVELRLRLLPDGRWWPVHSLEALALYGHLLLGLHRLKRRLA